MKLETEVAEIKGQLSQFMSRVEDDRNERKAEIKEIRAELNQHKLESAGAMSAILQRLDNFGEKLNDAADSISKIDERDQERFSVFKYLPHIAIGMVVTALVVIARVAPLFGVAQ